jgi:phospholipid transport system substrate-binding protein
MLRDVVRLVGALWVLVTVPVSAAEPEPPDDFVRAEIGALGDLLTGGAPDRVEVLRDRIRAIADFDGFARKSLGKRWATLSAAEQRRFKAAIQRLLESYYMSKPGSIFDKRKVSVQGAKVTGEEADVALTVARKDADVAVVVKLQRVRGGWVAQDVAIDGLSLLEDYRAQFRSFLRKRSVRELIERLESRAKA